MHSSLDIQSVKLIGATLEWATSSRARLVPFAPSSRTAPSYAASLPLQTLLRHCSPHGLISSGPSSLPLQIPTAIAFPTAAGTTITNAMPATTRTFSFSVGLEMVKELIFGVLAVSGCLMVQCLLIAWLALSRVQIQFLLLQARMITRVKTLPFERTPGHRSVGTQTDRKIKSGKRSLPRSDDKACKTTTTPAPLAPSKQPADPPAVNIKVLKATEASNGPEWQTQSVVERKPTGKRPYAMKQVDKPTAVSSEIVAASKLSPKAAAFRSLLDNRQPSPVRTPAVTHKPNDVFITKPAVQQPMARTGALNNFHSSSDSVSSSVEVKISDEGHQSRRSIFEAAQQEPARAMFKFSKSSGVKLVKHESSTSKSMIPKMYSSENQHQTDPEASGSITNAVVAESDSVIGVTESNLPYPTPPKIPSTPVKRYELGQMHKLRESPLAQGIEGLPTTENWMETAKAPGTFADPFLVEPKASITDPEPSHEAFEKEKAAIPRPSLEEIAREALVNAFQEREAYRLRLNNSYSSSIASVFKDKAKAYKEKRYELISHMPSGRLNDEDAAKFPYLSSMDAGPPPVSHTMGPALRSA